MQSGQVVLEVTDSGSGMDDEGGVHALDRFWRADSARTKAGSGLGLFIVRGIASAHGGHVSLTSDPRRGTKVRVVLPISPPRVAPLAARPCPAREMAPFAV
jgi:two-component system OmpR family sensor kinase